MKTRLDDSQARPRTDGPNPSQLGKAAEFRFASLAILGSGGTIEMVPPISDDERRDFELHLKHGSGAQLSIQVKVASALVRQQLHIAFNRRGRSPEDPGYWFFVGLMDVKERDFADPVFLIPSRALRVGTRRTRVGGISLEANSHDRWARYRVTRRQLGERLVEILTELDRAARQGVV